MMGWFYDHLARLIYVEAQHWKPTNLRELQGYVDNERRSHSLEGYVGECILPNWTLFSRECQLYADIVTSEDGEPTWNTPEIFTPLWERHDPPAWQICNALDAIGAFTRKGLDIVSSAWAQTDFDGDQHRGDAIRLTQNMLLGLENAGLISDDAREEQLDVLFNHWQLPMYRIDFKRIEVSLESLKSEQERMLWAEIGY